MMIFLNTQGQCDPESNVDGWSYTSCFCADWHPCICRIPEQDVTSTDLPTSPPVENNNCNDSPFRFRLKKNGRNIARDCTWVRNRDTINRCSIEGVPSMCPSTCNKSCNCVDGTKRFRFPWKGKMVSRDCTWVGNKQTRQRCAVPGMSDTCSSTCDNKCSS